MLHEYVELARIALASKIDNPKSSTSLVCLVSPQGREQYSEVLNKQNLQILFPEIFHAMRPENRMVLFSCLTPSSAYEKSAVRWLRALS